MEKNTRCEKFFDALEMLCAFGLFAALLFAAIDAKAEEYEYGVGAIVKSIHYINQSAYKADYDYHYNEDNPGLYLTGYMYNDHSRAVQLGFYKNSEYKWSYYVSYKMYNQNFGETFRPFFQWGIVTGYEEEIDFIPMVVFGVDVKVYGNNKINLLSSPLLTAEDINGDRHIGIVFAFQYERLF